jgi:putative hemolysin
MLKQSPNISEIKTNSAVRYAVKIAETLDEINSSLRLRFEVFNVEMSNQEVDEDTIKLEFDEFDAKCRHLIVIELETGKTVGTYRLNCIETVGKVSGFYSFTEFSIEDLPTEVLAESVEIGRACIAREHRNTKVLFLLWKGLADFLKQNKKRYLFGCCSIFTTDAEIGSRVFKQLENKGFLHGSLRVVPRKEEISALEGVAQSEPEIELPNLFNMYLKIGAKICSKPMIDHKFGTIDYFVMFDLQTLNRKYRTMFFGE